MLTISALFAVTAYAFAQMSPEASQGMQEHMNQMHQQMMQGNPGTHGEMGGMGHQSGTPAAADGTPTMPGQDAFGAIQEIVQALQANPNTDWSKVNIEALRQHLIDMNEVTLHAAAVTRDRDNGIEIEVTGEGRTLQAIKRMLPAHVKELGDIGWTATSDELPNGIALTVMASEKLPLTKLKALGFMGIMVQGAHHQQHHRMIAEGQLGH